MVPSLTPYNAFPTKWRFHVPPGALKTQEWTTRHQVAGVENVGRFGVRRRNGIC